MKSRNLHLAAALAAALVTAFAAAPAVAQEGFGFGEADDAALGGAPAPASQTSSVSLGGAVEFGAALYADSLEDPSASSLAAAALGRLELEARGSSVDAALRLKISEAILSQSPASVVDEASVRLYLGPLALEGGLLKLSWGKADSQGPLDVLNPLDLTDLTVTDPLDRKIARPMLRANLALGDLSKLEAVLLYGFEGHRLAWTGRWTPAPVVAQKRQAKLGFYYGSHPTANGDRGDGLYNSYYMSAWSTAYAAAYSAAITGGASASAANTLAIAAANSEVSSKLLALQAQAMADAEERLASFLDYPETESLDYTQAGLRFTTSLGAADLGFQYFYGFLPKPAISADPAAIAANGGRARVSYNRYHQIGADFAAVLLGLNLRAEAAANLTEDWGGDDPLVYNPALLWSLGFDRDLFAGVNLNLQASGSYRLWQDQVGSASVYDVESGLDRTSSKLTAVLSQRLRKDTIEWKLTGLVGIEDRDFLLMPSLGFTVGDARLELSGGIFGGEEEGELGQFRDASFIKLRLVYEF